MNFKHKTFSACLAMGLCLGLSSGMAQGRKTGNLEYGVVYMQAETDIEFLEDHPNPAKSVTPVGAPIGIEDDEVDNAWLYLEYEDGNNSLLLEYMTWDDTGSYNVIGTKNFGPQAFTGNVSTKYEMTVLSAMIFEKSQGMGEFGLGFMGVRQALTLSNASAVIQEEIDLPLMVIRWRFDGDVAKNVYYKGHAQVMNGVEGQQGYEGLGEIGYLHKMGAAPGGIGSDYIRLGVGYRHFVLEGDKDDGNVDIEMTGPYIRAEMGSRF